jgi:hypothetical protein
MYRIEAIEKKPTLDIEFGFPSNQDEVEDFSVLFKFDNQVDWTPEDIKRFTIGATYIDRVNSLRVKNKQLKEADIKNQLQILYAIEVLGKHVNAESSPSWFKLSLVWRFQLLEGYSKLMNDQAKEASKKGK